MSEKLSAANAPLFLREAAKYFESQATRTNEDAEHWAFRHNAERCVLYADALDAQAARIAELEREMGAGREWVRRAWHELNTIRARDGAPEGVSHEWWDDLTDALGTMLGDERVPWQTKAADLLIAPHKARAEAAEARIAELERTLGAMSATTGEPMREVPTDAPTILKWAMGPGPRARATVDFQLIRALVGQWQAAEAERDRLREVVAALVTAAVGMPVSSDNLAQGALDDAISEARAIIAAMRGSNGR